MSEVPLYRGGPVVRRIERWVMYRWVMYPQPLSTLNPRPSAPGGGALTSKPWM